MTSADAHLGEVLRDGTRTGLRYERRLRHPPEKVWRALTESEQLRHWFPADIVGERRAGATLSFPFWQDLVEAKDLEEPVLTGELLVWQPPHTLELTWDADWLRWELEPDGDGTRLVFTTWLGDGSPSAVTGTGAGYHLCLDALERSLETGAADGLAAVDPAPLEERYRTLVETG